MSVSESNTTSQASEPKSSSSFQNYSSNILGSLEPKLLTDDKRDKLK